MKSKEKLKQISHHLWYEFSMFLALPQELAKNQEVEVLSNALIESFAIHVRNLIDFLYKDNSSSDDVFAGDFFKDKKDWIKIRPPITSLLNKIKKRTNKEASHLTYKRIHVTPEEKKWNFSDITQDMFSAFEVFIENVDKVFLDSNWDNFFQIRENYKRRLTTHYTLPKTLRVFGR